jgi:hypothetical protein
MAVLLVPPTAKTEPSGRSAAGPISSQEVFGNLTTVLPMLDHLLVPGLKTSEFVPFQTSTVRTSPLGNNSQPSSEF